MTGLVKRLKDEFLPAIDKHPLAEEIHWERHSLFMAEVGSRMVGSVIVACIVGLMFYSSATSTALLTWFSGILFVAVNSWLLIRLHYRSDHRQRSASYIRKWHWINLYLSVIWGIFWALTPFLFFPDASQIQILSLLLLVVVASSMPSVTMGCYPDIYITFLTPVFFSFSWHLLSVDFGGEVLPLIIAPLTWLMLVLFSVVIHRTHMESIILRLEHRKAHQAADERTAAKTRFIAVASHDLRQPVQAARLYAESMLTNSNMRTQDTAEKLARSLTSASSLLDRLLDISKLDAGVMEVHKEDFSVSKLLKEISAVHSAHALEKGLQLQVLDIDGYLYADRGVLTEILDNIIANAVRYTDSGSVTVSAEKVGTEIQISVTDTGCGIPPEKQDLVFEEFVQLESSEGLGGESGMGLGLPIVHRLCNLHELRYDLESEVGKGTTFRIFVAASENKFVPADRNTKRVEIPPLRIMVVDDDPLITDALSMLLVSEGHDVWVCHSLSRVKSTACENRFLPDLVITDDRLPGSVTSTEVRQTIKGEFDRHIPIIVMTGNTSPERIQELRASGCPLLFKPVGADELMNTVRVALER